MPLAPRMGTPVVQMGFHPSPFVGGRTSVHSYPPATTSAVIHRRGPVRRRLWVTDTTEEEDDDVYEDLMTRRLHNRRVKRALESLGIKPKRRRRDRDDEY